MMMANSNALKSSALYIGYLILKEIQKQGKDKLLKKMVFQAAGS